MDDTDQHTGEGSTDQRPTGAGPTRSPRPPLHRRQDDRIVAGVASGLAAYLNVDPALVRIGFVVLTFAGGIGVPAYVAAWLLMPEADEQETAAHELVRSKGPAFWVGIGILVLVALALSDAFTFGRGAWWPVVLIAAGIALWRAGQRPPGAAPTASPPTAAQRGAATPTSPAEEPPMDTATRPTAPPPASPPRQPVEFTPPPVRPRGSSVLPRVTVALALIAAGVTVLLDRADVVDARIGHVLASSLVVVGLGLVVGAWFGRARALIVAGLVLAPMVLFTALFQAADVPWDAGLGERTVRIDTVAASGATYRLAAGELNLHLDGLPRDAGEVEVRAEVGAGQINVRVPSDAEVRVRARANAGELVLFDRTVNGVGDLDESVVREGEPGAPAITLDLRTAVGQIVVRTGAESAVPSS